ncbi:hypothetical protein PV325_012758 [Microctonus aethiopoides]|uniref:Programmed cell death protein 7 n=1 Tax=Microctonus aethiopoides TaxID=144406 RepID=A0AA39FYD7_9HYME|nr:hypothetical protein PV325_012758 [Microctonus aethiopoides]KAK0178008.1 hypothetical protein PV328_001993 [Microctonus aethiopoides]
MYDNSHYMHNNSYYTSNNSQFYTNPCNYADNYGQFWFNNSPYGPNIQTNIEPPIIVALNQRKKDTKFFENFINEHTNAVNVKSKTIIKSKRLGISQTRTLLASIKKHNVDLKDLTSVLEVEKNNLSEFEWQEKVEKCNIIKAEIIKLLTVLQESEKICKFSKLIEKRRKKRQREKKSRAKWKAIKIANDERRCRLHAEADTWIREKQAVIEREKQEENLRKDADMVLSDIRSKRSDAKKCLALLNELQNLRKVKANNARARGEKLSAAADESFENIIAGLTAEWTKLNREYSIEEQGLKLMLKTDNEKIIEKQKKNSFDEWEIAIFGRRLPPVDSARKDFNNLVIARFAWDKYINYHGYGSRIPIGWVMPESPSSAAWQKLLKNTL